MNPLWTVIVFGFLVLFVVVIEVVDYLDRRAMRGLEEVYRREAALVVLEGFTSHSVRGTDRCLACGQPVLVENTDHGICADCMNAVLSFAYENDALPAPDAEWADLMRAIEDEKLEGEDHR